MRPRRGRKWGYVDSEGNPRRVRGEMVIKERRHWKTKSAEFSSASFSVRFGGGDLILGRHCKK